MTGNRASYEDNSYTSMWWQTCSSEL